MSEYIYNLNTVGIPSEFIEKIMPHANGAFVKVYLYAINAAAHGKVYDCSEIASALDLLESDVVKAFEFLTENNCVKLDGDKIIFINPVPVSKTEEQPVNNESENVKYTDRNIKKLVTEDKTLSDLCLIAQDILGKTLSDNDIEILYWFYDYLLLSPEVITMLLEYCVSNGKRNMKYIEKTAINWHENNITTVEAADRYMTERREQNSFMGNMKKLLGIDNRNFSKTEETYLKKWADDFGMSEDMIALAYEYCIINTGKLTFPYMNTIIENWHSKGILTVPEAEQEKEAYKSGKELNVYKDETGFDYGTIEEIMQKKYDN